MRTKHIFPIIALAAGMQLVTSCKDSFLDVQPKGSFLESNYYRNEAEAYTGLVAVYDVVGWQSAGFITKVGTLNSASDDHFAGGATIGDIQAYQVMTNWQITPFIGPQEDLWKKGFAGVFRANTLLQKLPAVPMDEGRKKRFVAEAKYLRAFFYFDLIRFFKNIPLLTQTVTPAGMYDVPQAAPADVYAQIISDLKDAIAETNLPDRIPVASEGGRISRGAAHALLGKVYLYQQRWTEAAAELKEVNGETPGQPSAKYGYQLVEKFADLWRSDVAHKFNSESVMEISFTSLSGGTWGTAAGTEGNMLNILVGPRKYEPKAGFTVPDFVSGWGFNVVSKELYNVLHFDPRFNATIADLDSMERIGAVKYEHSYNNTGYYLNKFAGRVSNESQGGGDKPLNFPQNMYEIRLADTYLMEAEARVKAGEGGGAGTRAYALLNAVRTRVGLGPVVATFDNIFNERRLELAGEGHRFFDLVRTGKAAAFLSTRGFTPDKNEILPIPQLELENTKLEQSREWGGNK
ncbi:RagB/SusD family nutrient uptake outer membrane protein [Chitinophaga solisilvae]|uniref:RagB/SusD family nutrient uptake outer membrane protein n=1 Tax=Chitinophaga solisilvae TaxID=1233460 RepID=UPI00136AFF9D|nr:RagB/SusD family nutrient uptake outer membrane protein [Chitinophaga solisilvae]